MIPPPGADDEQREAFERGYGQLLLAKAPAHLDDAEAAAALTAADPEVTGARLEHDLAHRRFASTGDRSLLDVYYGDDRMVGGVRLGLARQVVANARAATWGLGTILLKGAPAEMSEAEAAREIAASPLGELDEIGELLARRRFVLTGDLALAD